MAPTDVAPASYLFALAAAAPDCDMLCMGDAGATLATGEPVGLKRRAFGEALAIGLEGAALAIGDALSAELYGFAAAALMADGPIDESVLNPLPLAGRLMPPAVGLCTGALVTVDLTGVVLMFDVDVRRMVDAELTVEVLPAVEDEARRAEGEFKPLEARGRLTGELEPGGGGRREGGEMEREKVVV